MKVRTILLSMVLVAGVSLNVSAQFKIGGKSINTKKLVNAASDVAKAVTLSDEDVAAMAREYIQWMDTHNEIAGPETAMGQRLANLTKDIKVDRSCFTYGFERRHEAGLSDFGLQECCRGCQQYGCQADRFAIGEFGRNACQCTVFAKAGECGRRLWL